MVKFTKTKPARGPNARQMIEQLNKQNVEMKKQAKKKECITPSKVIAKRPKTAKEKKIEIRKEEQNDFLLFLKEGSTEEIDNKKK